MLFKGFPGWGANPGSSYFVYFLIPSLHRCYDVYFCLVLVMVFGKNDLSMTSSAHALDESKIIAEGRQSDVDANFFK
jgi:hypothetical protein